MRDALTSGKQLMMFGLSSREKQRSIRHDMIRSKQSGNDASVHHPDEKLAQLDRVLQGKGKKILELFSGRGNLTKLYEQHGEVECYDRKYLKTGDSYIVFHRLIGEKKTYDIIDLDPYGFPNRFFPDIFLLIKYGLLIVTMPKPYVQYLNGITQTFLTAYFGEQNPGKDVIVEQIATWGICHWRKVSLLDSIDLNGVWRFVFEVQLVKATEYTGVRNR